MISALLVVVFLLPICVLSIGGGYLLARAVLPRTVGLEPPRSPAPWCDDCLQPLFTNGRLKLSYIANTNTGGKLCFECYSDKQPINDSSLHGEES